MLLVASADAVNAYLTALNSGDFKRARALVAEGFSFRGPFVQADGGEALLESAEGLKRIARGHMLLRQLHDGDSVCSCMSCGSKRRSRPVRSSVRQ